MLTHDEVERAVCAGGIIHKEEWRKMLADEQAKTIIGTIGRLVAAGWEVRFQKWSPACPVVAFVSNEGASVVLYLSPADDSDANLCRQLQKTADMLLNPPADPDLRDAPTVLYKHGSVMQ